MRPLATYLAEVIRIREELKDTIFLGDYLDTLGVSVEAAAPVRYGVHRNRGTGQRACVLLNLGEEPREASVAFEGRPEAAVRIYEPFRATRPGTSPVTLSIPGERVAIVVEA